MVSNQVFHVHALRDGVLSHGNSLCTRKIILGDSGTCQFVVSVHEVHGHAIDGLCHNALKGYAATVAIIHGGRTREGRRGRRWTGSIGSGCRRRERGSGSIGRRLCRRSGSSGRDGGSQCYCWGRGSDSERDINGESPKVGWFKYTTSKVSMQFCHI